MQISHVAFPYHHWTKDHFNPSILWQKGKALGKELLPAPPPLQVQQRLGKPTVHAWLLTLQCLQLALAISKSFSTPAALLVVLQSFSRVSAERTSIKCFTRWDRNEQWVLGTRQEQGGFRVVAGNKQFPDTALNPDRAGWMEETSMKRPVGSAGSWDGLNKDKAEGIRVEGSSGDRLVQP